MRLTLVGVMAASLIVSATLPEAFGERGLMFAGAYVAMQVGRTLFAALSSGEQPAQQRNFQRILVWQAASGVLWIAGGMASESTRELLWVAAVIVDYAGPLSFFITPGLGRSTTHDWNISGHHMAQRCELFLIIALGESILLIGGTVGDLDWSGVVLAAFVVAFLGSVALWWVYFDRSAGAAEEAIATANDPGRLASNAYAYIHILMVAGVIVTAVGDELSITHPLGHASPQAIATVLGGPALFLAGHLLFKRAVFGVWSRSRVVAIAALAIVAALGQNLPPLALAAVALFIVTAVSWRDVRTAHHPAIAAPAGSRL